MDNLDKTIIQVIEKQKKQKRKTMFMLAALVAVIVIIFAIIPKPEQKPERYQPGNMSFEAEVIAMGVAEQALKNPETSEFKNTNVTKSGQTYTVTGKMLGQNDFGVKKAANFKVVLEFTATSKPSDVYDKKHWKLLESIVE